MTRAVSKGLDKFIPGDWDSEMKGYMDKKLKIGKPDEYNVSANQNLKQGVTILPNDSDYTHSAFNIFKPLPPVIGSLEITEFDPDYPSIFEISEAVAKGEEIPTVSFSEETTNKPILAPFSLYYPSVAWPFATEEGKRYTVLDLGNEEIDDFTGKEWIEWMAGRKYDKYAALPGYRFWGDPVLGMGATAPVIVVGGLAVITFPFWGPSLGVTATKLVATMVAKSTQLVSAVVKTSGELAKSFGKSE